MIDMKLRMSQYRLITANTWDN